MYKWDLGLGLQFRLSICVRVRAAGGQVTGHGGATLISTFDNIEIKSGEEGHGSSCFKWNKMSPRDSSTEDLLN